LLSQLKPVFFLRRLTVGELLPATARLKASERGALSRRTSRRIARSVRGIDGGVPPFGFSGRRFFRPFGFSGRRHRAGSELITRSHPGSFDLLQELSFGLRDIQMTKRHPHHSGKETAHLFSHGKRQMARRRIGVAIIEALETRQLLTAITGTVYSVDRE
jgi:hypothetical protein